MVFAPAKALWNLSMLGAALLLAPLTFSPGGLLVFFILTYVTLLLGHSVGMHRRFIHRAFDCPKWLERFLVYLGTLVGMAGPLGILRIHDLRDWAQREPDCHDFFSHRRSLWVDAWWQLTSRFEFERPPRFKIEPEFAQDGFYRWLERTWMLQQVPLAVLLYYGGGWSWVVWGVPVRVCVSVIGHWVVPISRTTRGRAAGMFTEPECRRRICRDTDSSRWASAGTTTTTRSRSRRASAFLPVRWIPPGRSFAACRDSGWYRASDCPASNRLAVTSNISPRS